jgi:hypothetical protein
MVWTKFLSVPKFLWFVVIFICCSFPLQRLIAQEDEDIFRVREKFPSVTMKTSDSAPPEYCESFGGSTTFERISKVSVVEIPGNLLDITVEVFIANPTGCKSGEPCPIYDNSPEYVNIWIDWNGNFLWEPHEQVLAAALTGYRSINYGGTMIAKTTVAIPANAKRPTWLRANLGWGHNPTNPCERTWSFGNVFDQPVLWNVRVKEIDASLDIKLPEYPVFLPLWTGMYGSSGELIDFLIPRPVIAGMGGLGWFNLHLKLVSFPEELGENVRANINWDVIGTGVAGNKDILGKEGSFRLRSRENRIP